LVTNSIPVHWVHCVFSGLRTPDPCTLFIKNGSHTISVIHSDIWSWEIFWFYLGKCEKLQPFYKQCAKPTKMKTIYIFCPSWPTPGYLFHKDEIHIQDDLCGKAKQKIMFKKTANKVSTSIKENQWIVAIVYPGILCSPSKNELTIQCFEGPPTNFGWVKCIKIVIIGSLFVNQTDKMPFVCI
jgi:hypothetical protein